MSFVVLGDVVRFLRRFVVLSDRQADAVALWAAHTHAAAAAETTPYLAVTSALMRSGKSRLLEVLELLVHEPLPTANISDAALFRAIAELSPTLLLDEVDAIFGPKARDREDLRAMLNAGWRRGAVARRMGGQRMTTLESFPVFCPKALAAIGKLPDTVTDRAILIRLERRTREEKIERFRRREIKPEGETLRDRLADWLEPQLDHLHGLRPPLPDELDDRAQDCWEPLLAIAELAGDGWPARARAAAVELCGNGVRDDESISARLLCDVHSLFEDGKIGDRIRTADLIGELARIEESPWGDWHGKQINAHALSRLLQPFGIKTLPVKVDGEVVRGYKREQFADAFHRVLGVPSVTGVTKRYPALPITEPEVTLGNASNASGTGDRPYPGDDGFREYLNAALARELITERERRERRLLHFAAIQASA